jgi:hypothetical protein
MHYFETPSVCGYASRQFLEQLPKRISRLPPNRREAWGLLVKLQLAWYRVLFLVFLVWAATIAFASWWMIRRHPGDLQNATVPANYAAAFTGIAVFFPEIFNHYQRRGGLSEKA